jgi:hypothetical protein
MVTFSHNAGKMLSQYSREFEGAFLDIAKRRARSQFIAANLVRLSVVFVLLMLKVPRRYTTSLSPIETTRI